MPSLVDRILAALPQTQCTRCGFQDCRAYAEAIASAAAPVNQCPPGGQEGIDRLARIARQAALPLNPEFGLEAPRSVAVIDESWCIGCTLCIKACPTDAIVGANKLMHTVMQAYCTGCALCLPPCPVDCIEMVPVSGAATGWSAWSPQQAQQARLRYEFHKRRHKLNAPEELPDANKKQVAAQAALARARARRQPVAHKAEPPP
ncbi:RnfABCDGE type electron transport complex subunit B [Rhodoferax sp.]|uniref:RnfABCDGE type electron transport complex subunit B n=1 Tax=Rhodoferax sp. TaxID=50421 RepID=UPI00275D5736|nr:RnfABCDGE type electron transport complex subunit B [Rhodoferax sp.]